MDLTSGPVSSIPASIFSRTSYSANAFLFWAKDMILIISELLYIYYEINQKNRNDRR